MATTEELMAEYGVAWFGFDEASGNVYDKLGSNYVGTVTGATRVQGWNGEGNAMSFDGNDYISFNNKIIPIGEKSFRFKIKGENKTKNILYIISSNEGSSENGDAIGITSSGNLIWISNKETDNNHRFSLESITNVCDGKWHDIMLSWDGTGDKNAVKMYVNNMKKEETSTTALTLETKSHSNNLHLGCLGSGSERSRYFNGQIDDLQIYSKALTPADFTQQRIAIKTGNSRILSLSNDECRVKDLPTSNEADLINHSYVWREIDNAVDRGIDLTQTITEYEIVSETNTSLGAGKMFTIPLPTDFKTIKVEDNY